MKYTYVFDYDGDWMVLLYEEGVNIAYFNSAEDDWDKSLQIVEIFNAPKEKNFYYKLDSYDQVEDIDIFDLDENGLDCFKEFRR